MKAIYCSIAWFLFGAVILCGQASIVIMGGGYEYPVPLYVSPGQLVTVFVQGVPLDTPFVRSDLPELPTTLAGISAHVEVFQPGLHVWQLPIVEVRPFRTCSAPGDFSCYSPTAAVTVQIPFEILSPDAPIFYVAMDNQRGRIDVVALPDRVHLLRAFDAVIPIPLTPEQRSAPCWPVAKIPTRAPNNLTGLPCPSLVTHADGTMVTPSKPARAGEELVAYATGLGRTNPPTPTGKAVTTSAPTETIFALDFNYRPNALGTRPPPVDTPGVPIPLYTGTVPASVGLYQINFIVPPPPPGLPACELLGPDSATGNVVYSNLTVSVGGGYSFDAAGICVDPAMDQTSRRQGASK